jgi:hypothetical protein
MIVGITNSERTCFRGSIVRTSMSQVISDKHVHSCDNDLRAVFQLDLSNVSFITVLAISRPFYLKLEIIFLATLSSLYLVLMLTSKAS